MAGKPSVEFSQLEIGYEFPPSHYRLDSPSVSAYLEAIEDSSSLYQASDLVPPTAVAAYAMKALAEGLSLPPGTIHVSQGLEFKNSVKTNDTLTSYARVTRKQTRGKLQLLTVALNVVKQNQAEVLIGETSFILPGEN